MIDHARIRKNMSLEPQMRDVGYYKLLSDIYGNDGLVSVVSRKYSLPKKAPCGLTLA